MLHDAGKALALASLGTTARMDAYLTCTELGAERLERIGSHPMVSA